MTEQLKCYNSCRNKYCLQNFTASACSTVSFPNHVHRFLTNGPTPASFPFIFSLFNLTLQFLQQINVKNVHLVYPWFELTTFWYESPPLTTRPELPPIMFIVIFVKYVNPPVLFRSYRFAPRLWATLWTPYIISNRHLMTLMSSARRCFAPSSKASQTEEEKILISK